MRVFVTGWDGLLGTALVPRLRAGHEVDGCGVADGDIADRVHVRGRFRAFRPDLVIHLAAMTAVDGCEAEEDLAFRVNAEGSRVAAAEAEAVDAAILAVSTDYVFDGTKGAPYTEDDEPRPLGVYGRSKYAGEEAIRTAAVRWAVVRSAWLYGAGGRNFVDTLAGLLERGERIPVVADQTGSPTYVDDLAEGLTAMVPKRPRGLYHLVNAGQASWCDLARETARLLGRDPETIVPATTAEIGRPAPRPAYSVLDAGRARERFGVELRPWRDALAAYLKSRPEASGR